MHLDYTIITTTDQIYMVIDEKLTVLNIDGFITASVSIFHNIILTTKGVLATGSNRHGQLGLHNDIHTGHLLPVDIDNVQSVSCG